MCIINTDQKLILLKKHINFSFFVMDIPNAGLQVSSFALLSGCSENKLHVTYLLTHSMEQGRT